MSVKCLRNLAVKCLGKTGQVTGNSRFEQYEETPKTIDSRIDQIMAKENNRRAAWLEKRRVAAAKSLDTKEEVITAAEEIVKKRPHK